MLIPSLLLKKLYTLGSLKNTSDGVAFSIKNRLSDAELVALRTIAIDGNEIPMNVITLSMADGRTLRPENISPNQPLTFPLRTVVDIRAAIPALRDGKHTLQVGFDSRPFGKLQFSVEDATSETAEEQIRIPRDANDDYTEAIIKERQAFVEQYSGKKLEHITRYSFDAHVRKAMSSTSRASRRCPSASPARSRSTARTQRASSSFPWRRPRGRLSPPTTAASRSSTCAAGSSAR